MKASHDTEYASRRKYGKIQVIILAALPQKWSERLWKNSSLF